MNVVAINALGLNVHWLGAYGNEWVATPHLDAWAARSVVRDRHLVAGGPADGGFHLPGVRSILIHDCRHTDPRDGWDRVVRTSPADHPTPAAALLKAVRSIRGELTEGPCLLWIETDRMLPPWDFEYETYQQYAESTAGFDPEAELPEPMDTPPARMADDVWHRVRNSYAAAVTAFDAEVGAILKALGKIEATRVFTSSFGLPLGEHGVVGVEWSRLHEERVHVPMWSEANGQRPGREASSGQVVLQADDERLVRTDEWAYLPATESQPQRLYVKPDDVWEANDVSARHPDVCDAFDQASGAASAAR